MSSNQIKRRNIFIKKAFQGRFIVGVFLLILLSSLCSALLIYWITGGDLQAQSQTAHVNIMTAWERLGVSIFIGNVVAFIVAGSLAVIVVLYASHKIAGPLYRFEVLCKQVGNGQLDTVTTLREKDQLQDLAEAFSIMVNKLRSQRSARQETAAKLSAKLEQLQAEDGLSTAQRSLLNEIEVMAKQLDP
jgi:methyl-accepting chemotaxis protein